MEVKPGYKQTEVGIIPEDWQVKPIAQLGQIKTGPFGTLLKADEYSENDGVPLISVGEIGHGNFRVTDKTPRIPEAVVNRLPQYVLKTGDIVFGRKGAVDRSVMVGPEQNGWFLGSDGISLRPNRSCHAPYLAWQFRRHEVQAWLLQNAVGTTMASLNQAVLNRVRIPYASIHEQRAIATALSDVDTLLAKLDQLITKKRDLKQAAVQQLITGQTRLPGFSGAWKTSTLGQVILRFSTGLNPRDNFKLNVGGEFFYVTIKNFAEGQLFLDEKCDLIDQAAFMTINERSDLRRNDILFSSIGRVGDAYLIRETPHNWNINESVFTLRPDQSQVVPLMLFYLLTSKAIKDALDQGATGSTFISIKQADLKAITCTIPVLLEEQAAIATVLSDMDAEIAALEARRDKTRALKQGMMQELLTGRSRLL